MKTDNKKSIKRREFIKSSASVVVGLGLLHSGLNLCGAEETGVPALLGGKPVRSKGWGKWPHWVNAEDEQKIIDVLRSGVWSRANVVTAFEKAWADAIGSKRCLAVVNGTNAHFALHIRTRNLAFGLLKMF